MPKMSSDSLVRVTRDRVGDDYCPLLFWSSQPPEELELLASRSGADGFIYKPDHPDKMLEVIAEYLR